MARNRDIERFKRDAKAFGLSAADHLPGVGTALGIHDTYQKGRRLANSAPKAVNVFKRRAKSRINRQLRRFR